MNARFPLMLSALLVSSSLTAQEITFPPKLPGGKTVVRLSTPKFLEKAAELAEGVQIAKTPPTVDFLFFPGQTYPGKPWSNWGDGIAVGKKYYTAIGDHYAVGPRSMGERTGDAFLYEYDSEKRTLRKLLSIRDLLKRKKGHYTPGKIHTRLGIGRDGWLYFATHRGSTRVTADKFHYTGDWLIRHHPETGKSEVLKHAPVQKHAIPTGRLDPTRLIYYGGTAPGSDAANQEISFFAWDICRKKRIAFAKKGPNRDMMITRKGIVYFNPGKDAGPLRKFDPENPSKIVDVKGPPIGLRAASEETPQGIIYTCSRGRRGTPTRLFAFNVKTEKVRDLGTAAVASQQYVTTLDADATGRFLYYVPGAHGGSERDGSPIIQFDTRTRRKKVLAFLNPPFKSKFGFSLRGTYSVALAPKGDKLYITWNISRGGRVWDCCGLTVVHIPASERAVKVAPAERERECDAPAKSSFRFKDVTKSTGLSAVLEGDKSTRPWRYGHAAGWGDVNGDGKPDLFTGAFAARKYYTGQDAPVPNLLFLGTGKRFELSKQTALEARHRNARAAGCLFADLDNDGDVDLVVANHVMRGKHIGSRLFENRDGVFRDVTPRSKGWPATIGARNVVAIDANNDGKLDLVFSDGSYGRTARKNARLILLENRGRFTFQDVTQKSGLPSSAAGGQGIAVGDVNEDGRLDIFVAGSNRMFVTTTAGKFREVKPSPFAIPTADVSEGLHCGAAFGDLDNDGDLDLVTTEHGVPARIHVFENRGIKNGMPAFAEITATAIEGKLFPRGTRKAPIKTAHVGVLDMDNDGRNDVVLTVLAKDSRGDLQPVVLRNLTKSGKVRFSPPPYDRMVTYYAPGPICDYDNDGRPDLFLPSWFEDVPSRLYRNVTDGGNWIGFRIAGEKTDGIGASIRIYRAGRANDAKAFLGRRDIVVGTGYASCELPRVQFGLGDRKACDVMIRFRGKTIVKKNIAAGRYHAISIAD